MPTAKHHRYIKQFLLTPTGSSYMYITILCPFEYVNNPNVLWHVRYNNINITNKDLYENCFDSLISAHNLCFMF